mmetsp:Transcript_15166/g.30192  ORF Transcript_15166/g.30192 Transcript_15166/m.30192 type:complete len:208 (+) Transcript_15166:1235-1858(+)
MRHRPHIRRGLHGLSSGAGGRPGVLRRPGRHGVLRQVGGGGDAGRRSLLHPQAHEEVRPRPPPPPLLRRRNVLGAPEHSDLHVPLSHGREVHRLPGQARHVRRLGLQDERRALPPRPPSPPRALRQRLALPVHGARAVPLADAVLPAVSDGEPRVGGHGQAFLLPRLRQVAPRRAQVGHPRRVRGHEGRGVVVDERGGARQGHQGAG